MIDMKWMNLSNKRDHIISSLLHQLTNQQQYHSTVQHIEQQSLSQSVTFIHAKLNMVSTLTKVYAFTVFFPHTIVTL